MRKDFKDLKKNCQCCGEEFSRKKYNKRYEDAKIFQKRKYCSRNCMSLAYTKQETTDNRTPSNARTTARIMNSRVLKESKCRTCGEGGRLDVHHVDGDFLNNVEENLMVLCRSCHMKIHKPAKGCKVEGCDNKHKGHGYCDKHYQRIRRHGNAHTVKWNTKHTKYDSDVTNN